MTTGWRRAGVAAAVAVLALAVVACGDNSPTSATTDTKQLEVVSWWTSGSEAAALDALFAAFRESNPGVDAVNGAVPGGAGSKAIVELAKRLQDNDPPDVWQTFAGKSVQLYASRGVIRSVAPVFEREDLRARMHPTILRSIMRDGRPYGVPTGAHRSNVLWFNRRLLERAGVNPHRAATPSPRFRPTSRRSRPPERYRCASAARTGSPRSSCSRTRCSARSVVVDGRTWSTTSSIGAGARGDGAEALRRVAALLRPAGKRVDLGRGDEEARPAAARSSQ